jgi:hypothetical protein
VNSGDSLVRRSTEHHRRTKSWLSCAERVARLAVCEPTAGTPADDSVGPQVSAAPEREPHHRRITQIAAWIVAVVVVLAFLRVAGVDVWGWLQQLWDTVTEISVGYVILGCFFQCLPTVLTALGWYGILKYAPPRAGDVHAGSSDATWAEGEAAPAATSWAVPDQVQRGSRILGPPSRLLT